MRRLFLSASIFLLGAGAVFGFDADALDSACAESAEKCAAAVSTALGSLAEDASANEGIGVIAFIVAAHGELADDPAAFADILLLLAGRSDDARQARSILEVAQLLRSGRLQSDPFDDPVAASPS